MMLRRRGGELSRARSTGGKGRGRSEREWNGGRMKGCNGVVLESTSRGWVDQGRERGKDEGGRTGDRRQSPREWASR